MSTKPGRNDPCHCGSGKKYKRCHLALDEQARLAARPPEPEPVKVPEPPPVEPLGDPGWSMPNFKNPREAIKMVQNSPLLRKDPELQKLFRENEALLKFMDHEDEILAALEKTKHCHPELEKLLQDEEAFATRAQSLFKEPAFEPLRFTAEDVQRAFEKIGEPDASGNVEKIQAQIAKAVRFLATKRVRERLSLELALLIPEYVRQGRHLDARIIDFASQITEKAHKELNPFLTAMFAFGVESWAAGQEQKEKELLGEFGFELKEGLTPAEIEAWVAQQSADPARTLQLEEFLKAHPEVRDRSQAAYMQMMESSRELLERDDAKYLLLTSGELEPQLAPLSGQFEQLSEELSAGPVSQARKEELFSRILLPVLSEIAGGIFTPERLSKLVADLKAYRDKLFAAGEKKAWLAASGAISSVEHETEPEKNAFLLDLCFRSIRTLGQSADDEPAEDTPNPGSSP